MSSAFLQSASRVLGTGLLLAGDVIAKAATAPAGTFDLATVLGGAAVATATGVGVNQLSEFIKNRQQATLPETRALLRNHDLRQLTSIALERTIQSASDSAREPRRILGVSLREHADTLRALAKEVRGLFETLDDVPDADLASLSHHELPSVALRFWQAPEGRPFGSDVPAHAWRTLLEKLAERAAIDDLHLIEDELVDYLSEHFSTSIVQVFAEDAAGKGPSGGRGWMKLTLLFWGKLLSEVQGLGEQTARESARVTNAIAEAESRLQARLDELIRWHGALATGDEDLERWLRVIHHDLGSKLDEVARLVAHGLQSPEGFCAAYWARQRIEPGMTRLWSDPLRAEILTDQMVGRDKELADFEAFLSSPAAGLQHIKGWPGTGKSRLLIEFARRAVAQGHHVYFVNNAVHDLGAALIRAGHLPHIVLLWDDYRGDNQAALQVFLNLDVLPATLTGSTVKRVITTWPTQNILGLGRFTKPPLAVEKDLWWSVASTELVAYTQRLLPPLDREAATRIVTHTRAHPFVTLRAVAWVLEGNAVDDLPSDILDRDYDKIIRDVTGASGLSFRRPLGQTLLAMALAGSFDFRNPRHHAAYRACQLEDEWLGVLVDRKIISAPLDGAVYSLTFDSLRAHVIRRSLDRRHVDVLSGSPQELAAFARPLLREWLDVVWSICILATEGTTHLVELQDELLLALDATLRDIAPDEALGLATRIVNATTWEPHPERALALAARIEQLLAAHSTDLMALKLAQALRNITILERDFDSRKAVADKIDSLLARHDTSAVAVELAKALLNATVVAQSRDECELVATRLQRLLEYHETSDIALQQAYALCNGIAPERNAVAGSRGYADHSRPSKIAADRIAQLAARYDTKEIAVAHAQALLSGTAETSPPEDAERLAEQIGQLLIRHDVAEIAVKQSQALSNATVVEKDPERCVVLADRIGRLRERHPVAEILLEEARALLNATLVEHDALRCGQIAARIGALVSSHPEQPELAVLYARALRNLSAHDIPPERCEALADDIGSLLERHNLAEIANEQAVVLFNATVDQLADRCEILANRIERLRLSYETPEIAFRQAQALSAAMSGQSLPRREDLAQRIRALLTRHPSRELAMVLALALDTTNKKFRDSDTRKKRSAALELLRKEFVLPS